MPNVQSNQKLVYLHIFVFFVVQNGKNKTVKIKHFIILNYILYLTLECHTGSYWPQSIPKYGVILTFVSIVRSILS